MLARFPFELPELKNIPLFAGLTDEQLIGLQPLIQRESFTAGEVILRCGRCGDTLFFLHRGAAKICVDVPFEGAVASYAAKDAIPSRRIIAIVGPGILLGEIHALDGLGHSAHAIALGKTTCGCLKIETFCAFAEEIPVLWKNVALNMAQCLRRKTNYVVAVGMHHVASSVAAILLQMVEDQGQPQADSGYLIPVPLTQGAIAAMVGHSERQVGALMRKMKNRGVIAVLPGRLLVVRDLDRLRVVQRGGALH